jgi:hypothetical protein
LPSNLKSSSEFSKAVPKGLGDGEGAYRILLKSFKETPIIRISRSYAEIVALETSLDLHPSSLGVSFPDDMVDGTDELLNDPTEISRVMEGIDTWFKTIITRVNVADTPSLSDFINPTEVR